MEPAEFESEGPGVDHNRMGGHKRHRTDEGPIISPSASAIQAEIQVLRNRLEELVTEKALQLDWLSRASGSAQRPCFTAGSNPARFGCGLFFPDGQCQELTGDFFTAVTNFLCATCPIPLKPTANEGLEDCNTCPPYNDFQATYLNDNAFSRRQHRRSRTQRRSGRRKNKEPRRRQSCPLADDSVGQSRSS